MQITILGRRWFDKKNGNTYFSSRIYVDGNLVHTIPHEYGYGDHYLDQSFVWLDQNGFVDMPQHQNGGREPARLYCERNGITLVRDVVDVTRKGDL